MICKKIITLTITILLICASTTIISSSRNLNISPKILKNNNYYCYGFNSGKNNLIKYKLIDLMVKFVKSNISESQVKNQIQYCSKYFPFFLDELKGLSDSLNIKLEKLIHIQLTLQKFFNKIISQECTVTLSTGNATKQNATFLTQNYDSNLKYFSNLVGLFLMRFFTFFPKVVRYNTIGYKYVYIGIPVLYEIPIINEKGLGFVQPGTGLVDNKSMIDVGPGMSTYLLDRLTMMICKNVSEVADLWAEMTRSSGYNENWPHFWDNSVPCWGDKKGGILAIEQTHNYSIFVFGNSTNITCAPEGILWHANHHQWLDPNLTGTIFSEEDSSSALRAERARELLEDNYGKITIETCKSICRDHGGGWDKNAKDSGDICRHPDSYSNSITAFSWIIEPKNLTVYISHRCPCNSKYTKHDFSDIFQ